ncbi:MAG TPA: hypothetical protein VFV62_08285 [Gaiellaceae bacterium]|nr:hypothetical protein [Gaiellaceae bacterium]
MLIGAAAGAWFAVLADDGYLANANVVVTVIALVVLAGGLVLRFSATVPAAITLLAAEYVAVLVFDTEALDTRAPLVAAALLAVGELAYWSLEVRGPVVDEAGTYLRRIALLALLVLGAIGLGTVVLVVVEVVEAGGVAVDMVGAAAALGALALLGLAARRTGP